MLIEGATVDLEQENQRLRAELRAQTQELRGSRARLVAVGDAERRRLERDLHDGAQSRFAGVALHLRLAQRKAPPDGELARMLATALGELSSGIDELRELARGIHPAILTQRGLEPALESLASRAPLPVDVRATLDERLPTAVETAAYFAVSEALTNVVKHARAGLAAVDVRIACGRLLIDVTDDGCGGASADGRLRPERPRRPGRRARRLGRDRQPARRRHARARRDPTVPAGAAEAMPAIPARGVNGLVLSGALTPADAAALCERARLELERSGAEVLVCDVAALTRPDAGTIEALARLQLTARRLGRQVRLRHPSPELRELLDLCGLSETLRVEPRRQPEEREQPLRVEERVDGDDPPV